jgi:hypothetical protein
MTKTVQYPMKKWKLSAEAFAGPEQKGAEKGKKI